MPKLRAPVQEGHLPVPSSTGRRSPELEQNRNSQIAQHLKMQVQEAAFPPQFWLDLAHPMLHWTSNRMGETWIWEEGYL